MAHAGWRGIVSGVVGGLVRTAVDRFGCRPEGMVAALSPSAGPCCYEVGDEVVASASQTLPESERHFLRRRGSTFFDLWSACTAQLHSAGIEAKRIDSAGECTICDERYFSYRRDGPKTGHAGLIAALSEG